jgi:hypothetical protein
MRLLVFEDVAATTLACERLEDGADASRPSRVSSPSAGAKVPSFAFALTASMA